MEALDAVLGQSDLPDSVGGLLRSHDTIEWQLEAMAYELEVILHERREQRVMLAVINERLQMIEGAGGAGGGDVGDVGGLAGSTVGGSATGGDQEEEEGEEEDEEEEVDEIGE